jgi:histidyl-tRNA synthetase
MRDFLPLEARRRQFLIDCFREVYGRYGFDPIDTPALERLEVLLGKGGEENEKLIYKVLKRGESLQRSLAADEELADAGLRFDLTVPLARYVVEHRAELPRVLRRYHIGPVWRADRPARGRFREFYQCDVDIVGAPWSTAEVEVILATADALGRAGFSGFSVRLNDRRLLSALLGAAGVPDDQQASAVVALDKMDKIGWPGIEREFSERGIPPAALDRLRSIDLEELRRAPAGQGLELLEKRLGELGLKEPPISDLRAIVADVSAARKDTLALGIDPLLARGMGYYTGPIFEIASEAVPFALGGGGRYDELVGRFAKESMPAVGFSIGFERVLSLMTEHHMFPEGLSRIDAYVTVFSPEGRAEALSLADELRASGLNVLLALQSSGLKPQLKEANERGARFTLIVGPSEKEAGAVQVKDMSSGEAPLVPRSEVASYLEGRGRN